MKKKILLILPLILAASACNPMPGPSTSDPEPKVQVDAVIENLLNNVNVKVTGYEKNTFPQGYEIYNSISYIDVNRDYSKIIEEDGSITPAVRENTNQSFQTYIKASDGGTVYEILNADNTIETLEYRINYNKVLFNERFGNPFEYLDTSDINVDGELSLLKANYIIELLTGLSVAPSAATIKYEGNYATDIEFEINDRIDIIETKTDTIYVTTSYEINIEFDYNVAPLQHLKPGENADEHIKKALSNKENYTLEFSTDLYDSTTVLYKTEDQIYIQNNKLSVGPTEGDTFYKKVGENTYESYVYRANVGKFNIDELEVSVDKILPDLTTINPNITTHESGSIYLIEKHVALNSLDNFIIPSVQMTDGYGINGTIILDENDNISQFRGTFMPSSPFNIIQNYYNYGSTVMPSWLDVDSIK